MMAGTLAPSSGKVARPKLPARARKRPWPVRKRALRSCSQRLHGGVDGGLLFQAWEQGDELVAAVSEAGVCGAEGAAHEAADLGQQAAADEVAVGVVDLLEVVEVDEEQAEACLGDGCGELDLLVQQGVEVAGVEEAGAVVGDGELVDELDRAGILDGDGGVVAEDAQEGDGVLALQVELGVEELDDAEGFLSGTNGDAGDGADS